jgi:hypothetical protein
MGPVVGSWWKVIRDGDGAASSRGEGQVEGKEASKQRRLFLVILSTLFIL